MSELTVEQGRALDLGYQIGQKREETGLSIEEVAGAIRLRRAHIQAIENGAFEVLPGEPYNRSYIKRYIEFLELDSEALLSVYDAAASPETRKLFMLPEIFSHETHADGLLAFTGLALALVLVVLWNWSNPMVTAPLVVPFAALDARSHEVLPHRCEQVEDSYPPCSWERLELWYRPTKPDNHIFVLDHDSTP